MSGDGDNPSRRTDKWFWCARRFKTRSIAAKFVADASVRITRGGVTHRVDKASFLLREGDEASCISGERLFVLAVTGFAEKRGSPAAANSFFADQGNNSSAAPPPCKAAR